MVHRVLALRDGFRGGHSFLKRPTWSRFSRDPDPLATTLSAFDDAVNVDNREDEQVVQEVHEDCGGQAVREHHVEEEHAEEPAVEPAEQTLVLVTVAEERVGGDDASGDRPVSRISEVLMQPAEGEEVGDGREQVDGQELEDAEAEEAEEQEIHDQGDDDGVQEDQPAEADFFHNAGPEADHEAACNDALGVAVFLAAVVGAEHAPRGDAAAPREDRPRGGDPVPGAAGRFPQTPERERCGVRPDPQDHTDEEEGDERLSEIAALFRAAFFAFAHRLSLFYST